jgi:predicted  nucleic acid-binding Zn-ribbon protein
MFSKRKFPSCVITLLASAIALYSCSNPSPSNSSSNSTFGSSQNCDTKVRELETKIQELNTELEETKTKLREAEFELFEFGGFKYTKTYNGVITHYYEDIRAAFDRAEDDIELLERKVSDLESDNRSLKLKLLYCD